MRTQVALTFITFLSKRLIDFLWYVCMSMCLSLWLLLCPYTRSYVRDTRESQVWTHTRETCVSGRDRWEGGGAGQEVTRVSSIATGMERCAPRCEVSQDEAKLRAAGPFCAWWLAADVLSWPVNTEDWVCAQGKKERWGEGGVTK